MAFQKTILPNCPQCKEPGLRVIESRKTSHGTRRRKECECCGIRFTTHEVSADFYEEAQQNLILVSKLYKLLGTNQSVALPTENKCTDCSHNRDGGCAFDFPEYDTPDSFDCNHYDN